jgi:hypothetical protein
VVYSSDIVISDSLQEQGNFALFHASNNMEFAQFDTYVEAKAAAIKEAKKYRGAVSVYLWGHGEFEPEIPMAIHDPGYKRLY